VVCWLRAGQVKSTKMTRTVVVRRDYLHYIKKYARCANAANIRLSLMCMMQACKMQPAQQHSYLQHCSQQ
jgi:hypothetical protein